MLGIARLSCGSGLGSLGQVWRTRKTSFKMKSCANFWKGSEGNGSSGGAGGERRAVAGTRTQCAQPLPRRLRADAGERSSDPESSGEGRNGACCRDPRLGEWGLHPDQGPRSEAGTSTAGKGRQTDMLGTGMKGLGCHRQYTGGACLPSLPSPEFQEETGLCWVEGRGAEGESTRGATGQGPVPGHVTRDCQETGRAKNQRNAEDTGPSYRGLGAVRVCGGDQGGPSTAETHSTATERCAGVRERRAPGLRRSGSLHWAVEVGGEGGLPAVGRGSRFPMSAKGTGATRGEEVGDHGKEGLGIQFQGLVPQGKVNTPWAGAGGTGRGGMSAQGRD